MIIVYSIILIIIKYKATDLTYQFLSTNTHTHTHTHMYNSDLYEPYKY